MKGDKFFVFLLLFFALNLAYSKWNKKPQYLSKFGNMTEEQKKSFLGRLPSSEMNLRTATLSSRATYKPSDYPDEFDSRKKWNCVHEILNQGDCGSCWAFSASEAASDAMCIQSNGFFETLSPQYLVSCEPMSSGCSGGYDDYAMEFIGNNGIVTDECFPYTSGDNGYEPNCPTHCTDSSLPFVKYYANHTCISSYDLGWIKNAIYTNGAVTTSLEVYSDFFYYDNGIYTRESSYFEGYHAIKAIGWGIDDEEGLYWIVANSWGTDWGEEGFFRIKNDPSIFMYAYTCSINVTSPLYDFCPDRCRDCYNNDTESCYTCKFVDDYLLVNSSDEPQGTCIQECPFAYSSAEKLCYADDKCPIGFKIRSNEDRECIEYKCSTDEGCSSCSANDLSCLECSSGLYMVATENSTCSPWIFFDSMNTCCVSSCSEVEHTYLDLEANQCQICNSSCKECEGPTSEDCTSCDSDKLIYFGSSSNVGSCVDECPSDTVPENNVCVPIAYDCHSSCNGCVGNSENRCISCSNPSQFLQLQESYQFGKCVEECDSNTYLVDDFTCATCHSSCQACNSEGTFGCTSCSENYFLNVSSVNNDSGSCIYACPNRTFESEGKCFPCSSHCLSCNNSESFACTSCDDNYFLQIDDDQSQGECLSDCKEGYYPSSEQICEACDSSCLTCSGIGNNNCTSCHQNWLLHTNYNESSGFCKEGNCSDNYILSEDQEICILLEYDCSEDILCSWCFSDGGCYYCEDPYYILETDDDSLTCEVDDLQERNLFSCCYSSCSDVPGTYTLSYRGCRFCDSPCKECKEAGTYKCTQCIDGYHLLKSEHHDYGRCVDECPSGMVLSEDNVCEYVCHSSCATCSGANSDDCLTCADESQYLLIQDEYYLSGKCVGQCNNSFVNETAKTCIECASNCEMCVGIYSTQCLECSEGYYLNLYDLEKMTGICRSSCFYDYSMKPNGTICYPNYHCESDSACESCWNSTACHVCKDDYFMPVTEIISSDFYICNPSDSAFGKCCYSSCDFIPNSFTYSLPSFNYCMPCSSNCETCIDEGENSCTSCKEEFSLMKQNETDEAGFCSSCTPHCLTCSGTSESDCTLCQSDYLFDNGKCVTNCAENQYESEGECKNCSISCSACTSYNNCTACNEDFYTLWNLTTSSLECLSSCPEKYEPNSEGKCEIAECGSFCLTCIGLADNECTSCEDSTYLVPITSSLEYGSCEEFCPNKTYSFNNVCLDCSDTCEECVGPFSQNCTKCSSDQFLNLKPTSSNQGTCEPQCKNGYYLSDDKNNICKLFYSSFDDPLCTYCSSESSCANCQNGYKLLSTKNSGICEPFTFRDGEISSCCFDDCDQIPNTFSNSSNQCYSCNETCASCINYELCLTCPSDKVLNITDDDSGEGICIDECSEGWTNVNGTCKIVCHESCGSCILGGAENCNSCAEGLVFNALSNFGGTGECLTSCPDGYYINNSVCQSCSYPCKTCVNSSNRCTSCQSRYPFLNYLDENLTIGVCQTECLSGFELVDQKNNLCVPYYNCFLDEKCGSCLNYTSCLECMDPYYLATTSHYQYKTDICNPSLYPEKNVRDCCFKEDDEVEGIVFWDNSFYFCDHSCKSCLFYLKSSCTSCYSENPILLVEDKYNDSGMCLSECSVNSTYINETTCALPYNCYEDESCELCEDQNTCISCLKGANLLVNSYNNDFCRPSDIVNSTLQECCSYDCNDDGLFEISGGKCGVCPNNCKKCSSFGEDSCYECYDGFYNLIEDQYFKGKCIEECPYFIYGDECIHCDPSCATCTSTLENDCVSCANKNAIVVVNHELKYSGKCKVFEKFDKFNFTDDIPVEVGSSFEKDEYYLFLQNEDSVDFSFSVDPNSDELLSFSMAILSSDEQIDISKQIKKGADLSKSLDIEIPSSIFPHFKPFVVIIIAEVSSSRRDLAEDDFKVKAIQSQLGPYEIFYDDDEPSSNNTSYLLYVYIGVAVVVLIVITIIVIYCLKKHYLSKRTGVPITTENNIQTPQQVQTAQTSDPMVNSDTERRVHIPTKKEQFTSQRDLVHKQRPQQQDEEEKTQKY